jgi:putative tryptophan/tyrosine transport system substrate-binding protein
MSALSQTTGPHMVAAWQRGLREAAFVDGGNVTIEYRFADGQYDRLPALAAEFVRRPVDLIVAQAPPAALAAKVVTTTIPIIFVVGVDPVAAGPTFSKVAFCTWNRRRRSVPGTSRRPRR